MTGSSVYEEFKEFGCHSEWGKCRVMSKGVTYRDICFERLPLVAGLWIDWVGERVVVLEMETR